MSNLFNALVVSSVLFVTGCAHQINITPPLNTLNGKDVQKISKNVAYYISPADLEKQVETPGGGGDKVSYYPYKESVPALKKILSNVFNGVHSLPSLQDKAYIKKNNISYVFVPSIVTDSSSDSLFTWPPTKFSVSLDCKALDSSGNVVWSKKVKGEGQAEFSEFKNDLSLSAKRASKKAFAKLQQEINRSGSF